MTVYIEYAFIENFLLDGVLLWLALKGVKLPVRPLRILLSSVIGGAFAVLFPLLALPNIVSAVLKISVGVLLCLLAYSKGAGKGFVLFTATFFALSCLFGGVLLPILHGVKNAELWTPLGFFLLTIPVLVFIKKVYARRAAVKNLYPCVAKNGERFVSALGFYDSGNRAMHKGIPVCFLSVDTAYTLFEEGMLFGEDRGQVCDEMAICTVYGEKKVRLYKGSLEITTDDGKREIKEVYFSPSVNIVAKEYKILLHCSIGEEL